MKRLIKKSGIESVNLKSIIESVLNKDNVKKYILSDVAYFAKDKFESNLDLDEDTVFDDYLEALTVDMSDVVDYLMDEIIEEFEKVDNNISEDEVEKIVYSKEFAEEFSDMLYTKLSVEVMRTIDDEKEDAEEMYGGN